MIDPTIPCVEGFFQFVNLRMEAYELRRRGLRSPDPVLASGWFPNVKRELDRGTIYFQQAIVGRQWAVIPLSTIYRLANRRQTFETYGGLPELDALPAFIAYLHTLRGVGGQIFTGRHQTIGLPRYLEALDGLTYLGDKYPSRLRDIRDRIRDGERERPWRELQDTLPGVSRFTAWQVVCDVMETYSLDENLWAYLGPGPQGAYQMLTGTRGSQTSVLLLAHKLREAQENTHQLTLKNIEHALCEYFRYTRAWWER